PRPGAYKLSNPGPAEIPRHRVSAGSSAFIDDHGFWTGNNSSGLMVVRAFARCDIAHDLPVEMVDDIVSEHATTVVALVNDGGFSADLGKVVAAEIAVTINGRVREINVCDAI